jgi:Glycosyl transferase family 90
LLQVPDVDAFMHFADVPVVHLGEHPAAAPLFSPCSSEAHAEIPWPDWSFWSGKVGLCDGMAASSVFEWLYVAV